MIKIENINTFGWEAAIRGMRNPMNSWEKSDSGYRDDESDKFYRSLNEELGIDKCRVSLGPNDEKLMKALIKGGPVEAKFRRMIHVQMDITAPLYWWKEFDTYKVGTVANSCSTMHKIADKEFTWEDFSTEHLIRRDELNTPIAITPIANTHTAVRNSPRDALDLIIASLNSSREWYLETKNKKYWWQMIQLLPTSYNQKRTVDLSYEVLANIYKHRKNHKLDEWRNLCNYMKHILPYSWIFTEEGEDAPKKEPQKEEEKNEKPASGRFPWGNDAADAMVYAVQYAEKLKKSKEWNKIQEEAKVENPKPESKEGDKDEVFTLAIIEAVGALREKGYNNHEIRDMLMDIFGEV